MKDWPTPKTIVFTRDRANPRRWAVELPEGVPIPTTFSEVIENLKEDKEVENAQLIGRQLHIWLTAACKPTSWDERIRPKVLIGATAVFGWRPQPTPVERVSTRAMFIIP